MSEREQLLEKAWAIFDRAADLEHRVVNDPTKGENAKKLAVKNATRKVEEAAALEAEAFASE